MKVPFQFSTLSEVRCTPAAFKQRDRLVFDLQKRSFHGLQAANRMHAPHAGIAKAQSLELRDSALALATDEGLLLVELMRFAAPMPV